MIVLNPKQLDALCNLADGTMSVTQCCLILKQDEITIELITTAEDMALIVNIEQHGEGALFRENENAYYGYEIAQLARPFMKHPRPTLKVVK
jgi:hypothetical protein